MTELEVARQLHQRGDLGTAERLYRALLESKPRHAEGHYLLGALYTQQSRFAEAVAQYDHAVALHPGIIDAWYHRGNALRRLNRLADALASYDRALALKPAHPDFWNDRGIALWLMERLDDAAASFDRAIALQPGHADAHNNRGMVRKAQGRLAEARQDVEKALALKPHYPDALNHLAQILCESGDLDAGFAAYRHQATLLRATWDDPAKPAPPHKARHDTEQRAWLAANAAGDGQRIAGDAVNPVNAAPIAEAWAANRPQIVVIDDLLTPAALEGLRQFCWGAPMWQRSYKGGYLGAFPEHGFACPLLAQIGEELRLTYPGIFKKHTLRFVWGFKYDSSMRGIAIHADQAAVNVNFWITPDEANRDLESGGLIIWDKAAPLSWDIAKYNGDDAACRKFLADTGARSTKIGYRANRAVIFDSNLFHETDRIDFRDGYLNRRINVTLLYGQRQFNGT